MSLFNSPVSSEESINVLKPYKVEKLDKCWCVETPSGQIIYFGDTREKNYTTSRKIKVKFDYINSHSKYWSNDDVNTSDFWERWLLYNKRSVKESALDIEKRFQIHVCVENCKQKNFTLPKSFKHLENKITEEIISI